MESQIEEFVCEHCGLSKTEEPKIFKCDTYSYNCCNQEHKICSLCIEAYILKHRCDDRYIKCTNCKEKILLKAFAVERKTLDDFIPPYVREYLWDTFSIGCIGLVGITYFRQAPTSLPVVAAFVFSHLISLGLVFGYHIVNSLKLQSSAMTTFFSKEKRIFYHWFVALYTMGYFAALYGSSISSVWLERMLVLPPVGYVIGSLLNYCIPNYFHLHKVVTVVPK